jgi:F-type H+-transporting ATPase subunit delta
VKLVDRLLSGKASAQTLAIVNHLVQQPRGRRIGELLRRAADIVAEQRGFEIVTVTTASLLTPAQLDRLVKGLEAQYGRALRVNTIVDPSVLGGVRVQIGDDVIDGSVASRLSSLRQKLAG